MKHTVYGLAALFLVTCKSAQPTCINPARINKEALCTMQFDPVCGCDGKTYSNACFAENAGITSFTKGTCPE